MNGITLPEEKSYGKHIWQTYHILLDKKIKRDELIGILKQKGIETNFGAYAVHEQYYYKQKYKYKDYDFLNSIYAHKHGMALPMHGSLKPNEIKYICNNLKEGVRFDNNG